MRAGSELQIINNINNFLIKDLKIFSLIGGSNMYKFIFISFFVEFKDLSVFWD